MTEAVKTRLKELLRECREAGDSPFSYRVAERRLDVRNLSDASINHNLTMAYGAVLTDLDQLGLSAFYRKDLAKVIGDERARRIVASRREVAAGAVASTGRASERYEANPVSGWRLLIIVFAIVFSGALLKSLVWPYVPEAETLETAGTAAPVGAEAYRSSY